MCLSIRKFSFYKNHFLFLIGFLAFLMVGCNRNTIRLVQTNAKEEVPVLDNLTFRFDGGLVPDSLLNQWDSTEYIRFEPAISGRFTFTEKDQLVFSPSKALLPATAYKAYLQTELLSSKISNQYKVEGESLSFFTPNIKVEDQQVFWTKNNSGIVVPQLDVQFNYPAPVADAKNMLEVEVDGKKADFTMITLQNAARWSVQLQGIQVADKDYNIKVVIRKGLTPTGGKNGLTEDQAYPSVITSPFVLQVNDVTTEHDGLNGSILLTTNQTLTNEALTGWVQVDPAIKFSTQLTDNGLLITSNGFDISNSYMVSLKKGLRGVLGGVLKEEYSAPVTFGAIEPSLSFGNTKAVYLSAGGQRNLELRIQNVPRIQLIVSKVYESNLLAAHMYGYYPKENNADNEDYYEGSDGNYTAGDVLFQQAIDTRTLPKSGNGRLLQFNPQDWLPGYKGVYHISVRSAKDYWISDSRFIALSDIGLIAKGSADKMLVFANSIASANAISGVGIQVYGANNQLIGSGSTNGSGVAEVTLQQSASPGFVPAMVIAKSGDDFNYLPFHNTQVNTSKFSVGGKHLNSTGLDAYFIPERDIYRPGETIHFATVVRDANRKVPSTQPLVFKMLMPNGKEMVSFKKTLDAEGTAEGSINLPATTITGTYVLECYNGNQILLTNQTFKVEDFVPDRIKVSAVLSTNALRPGNFTTLNIDAINYFGPPASGRRYETEIQVKEKYFNPEAYPGFDFSLRNNTTFFDKVLHQGLTDEQGKATETFTVPSTYANMGMLQARFFATVFDETGRPVSRNTTATILTQPYFMGIGGGDFSYAALNQPIQFPLIALNSKEQPASTKALVTIIKHEYKTVLQKSGGYFRYESQKEEKRLMEQTIAVQGESTAFTYIPRLPGQYEIRVAFPGAGTYVSKSFYSYGSWGSSYNDFEVNADGQVDISLDKLAYKKGETIKALFKAPFDGKMLVTIETNQVLSYQIVNVKNRTAALDFKTEGNYLPNVYVTATLFKPHSSSDIPLTAAHGITQASVTDDSKALAISIDAATTSRSARKQTITLKAAPGAMVNLAAVDNGILAVSGFETPDPYAWFFKKRALGVAAWDLYPLLFPEMRRSVSSSGGDGDLSMTNRQNPIPNKRFKLLSYWSGWRKAGSNGKATFEIDIPAFNGQVRLMAVAVKGDQFGAATANMQVADPLVISTSLPRFLSPSDSVIAGVTISNTTSSSASVTATLQISGPLEVQNAAKQQVTIAPNSETRVDFQLFATASIGIAKVAVEVNGLGERFSENIEIGVRPASSLQVRSGSGAIVGGKDQSVNLPVTDFLPGSLSYQFAMGNSPVVQLSSQLQYLVNYPFGCTEQTISAAFPQLYFASLSDLLHNGASLQAAAGNNVQVAIQKIKMRQLFNGGLTMWDGEGQEDWWVSAYAAHFLLEAQKAGYAPETVLLETLLQYLSNKLRKKETIDYLYNQSQHKRIAPKEIAYSLYVLALAGRPNIASMNYYKGNVQELALDSRYVLSAAYAIAGDQKSFAQLLPASFSGETSVAIPGGSLYSSIRDEALALNALLEVAPTHAQVPIMAKHLVDKLNTSNWYSTQEAVFSLLALGKMAKAAADNPVKGTLYAGGKLLDETNGNWIRLTKKQLGSTNLQLKTQGSGSLYYWWTASGISATGSFTPDDSYLKVRRIVFDRYGREISGNTFKQGDLLVIKVVLEKSYAGTIDNVVVTDILPAGWEIENGRLKDLPGMEWIKEESYPTHTDYRDDRIHFFTNLGNSRQVFYYQVRAVTPGTYRMGPISAGAMYQGEYHSYWGAGQIKVVR